jgi:hypothetical protein
MGKRDAYQKYFDSDGGKKFCAKRGFQVLYNVADDSELSKKDKIKFFKHLENYDGSDIKNYFRNKFFFLHQLKGRIVSDFKYENEIGHVMSKDAFVQKLEKLMPKLYKHLNKSQRKFVKHIDQFIISYKNKSTTVNNKFEEFVKVNGIKKRKIADFFMWTFERLDSSSEVYDDTKYDMKDLPCLLGLPNEDGTAENYNNIDRITFLLKVPKSVKVRKPTAFDAEINTCWRPGGKTKKHEDAPDKYAVIDGFVEYVHLPVCFKDITSNIYKLYD